MAEEEPKKKCGVVKKILKWFGLGVLGLLIVLGLIFQAPWKVIALLVVFLLAHTVLPRPGLKWFWAGVGVVFIALVIWVFLPEDDAVWRPYTFDEELAALEAKYAIPDEENAATIYSKLLASYDVNDYEPNFADVDFWGLAHLGPWRSEDCPEAAEWLEGHQGTIDALMEAAKKENCHFRINADPASFGFTKGHSAPMRRWAYLLIYAGNNDIGEGRTNDVIEKYVSTLQMGEHIRQQPATVETLVGISIEALALKQFNRFVVTEDVTEEHLSIIEKSLSEIKRDWSSDLRRFIEHEKLMTKNFWGMFYGVNTEGKVRLTHDIATSIKRLMPKNVKDEFAFAYWQRKLMKVTTISFWLYMPSSPKNVGEVIDECYERYYAMAEPDFNWQKEPEKPSSTFRLNHRYLVEYTTSMLSPLYHKIRDLYLRHNADKKGSRIIVGLRRYKNREGRWPGSLEEIESLVPAEVLVDPINNGTFVYKLTEENFTLYSKGKNNIDEGGERDDKEGTDDWLIWPKRKRSCEPKEEGTDDEKE